MKTIWLCVSAGNGPEECAYAASLTVETLLREIQDLPGKAIKANTSIKPKPPLGPPISQQGNVRLHGENVPSS